MIHYKNVLYYLAGERIEAFAAADCLHDENEHDVSRNTRGTSTRKGARADIKGELFACEKGVSTNDERLPARIA